MLVERKWKTSDLKFVVVFVIVKKTYIFIIYLYTFSGGFWCF